MGPYSQKIAGELKIQPRSVLAVTELLDGGATVPFIARYRKEATGGLDEIQITSIRDRLNQLRELDKRRVTVLDTIEKQGKLTDELKEKILAVETIAELEDLYLPYKPKRRTRATVAREKGLEPLAELIFAQGAIDLEKEAVKFVDAEKKVLSTDEALAGARDIIAEWVNENSDARTKIRELFFAKGIFQSKVIRGKEADGQNYKDYFDWSEPVRTAPSHRILAVRRGEKEEILMLKVTVPENDASSILEKMFVKARNDAGQQVMMAIADSYKRLLSPSMETEVRIATKERADQEAIKVFAENLRQLLMSPPLGQKRVMAIDPGYRTGCKTVCLDAQGKLLSYDTVYIVGSEMQQRQAEETILNRVKQHKVEFIAIGNGTASRETEDFVRGLKLDKNIHVMMISESGASIYSASDVAREEFPELDVTVRGSISIGRRLQDPLAELVKIDPKSIGVGQYQHDVDQGMLKQSLDDVVISCVNLVGVELNTASKQLLTYVSGLGPARAQTILTYRQEHGAFLTREDLLQISGLGAKAYEQAAGFLRIRGGKNPLDASAVHPERYPTVEAMTRDLQCRVEDLLANAALRQRIDVNKYVSDAVGLPTLKDILQELGKPGRDPRADFVVFQFQEGITKIDDLKPGMKLPGVVTNIAAFGAFVDIGVHVDGLVHVSQLADRYVKDPLEVVKLHQRVDVTVLEVDLERQRISLSMKKKLDQHFGASKRKN